MPARSDRYFKVSRATRNDSYVLFCSVQEQLALLLLSGLPLFLNCLEEVFSEIELPAYSSRKLGIAAVL
jgi:hypothetical protein